MVFNHEAIIGGGEISFINLIEGLSEYPCRQIVFIPGHGEIEDLVGKKGVDIEITAMPQVRLHRFHIVAAAVAKFVSKLKKRKIDIVHANGSRACFYSVLAGAALGVPVIWHVRETIPDRWFFDGPLAFFSRKVVCASQAVADERFCALPIDIRHKIEIVYNGVDPDRFRPAISGRGRVRDELGIAPDDFVVGMVANIKPLKGQIHLIRALAHLASRKQSDGIVAIFVGDVQDLRYRDRLDQEIRHAGIEKMIQFLPFADNPIPYYQAMDIFVLPSRREGFSRSLIEAMGSGLPVIASRINAIAEAAPDGRHATLIEPKNTEALAQAILHLVQYPEARQQMGARNRKRVIQKFTHAQHAMQVIRVYQQVLANKRRVV